MGELRETEAIDRRTVLQRALRAGAAGVIGAGVPGLLTGCGTTTPPPPKRSDYYIGYDLIAVPPYADFLRLITARARQLNVSPVVNASAGANLQFLGVNAGPSQTRDSVSGRYPPANSVVVIGFSTSPQVEAIVVRAVGIGTKVVGLLQDYGHDTSSIRVDPARMGALLASHVARWAGQRLGGRGSVLIVGPSATDAGPQRTIPFASTTPESVRALRDTLAHSAPRLRITSTETGIADALKAHPDVRIVLCWNDEMAVSAAQALRARDPGGRGKLYVGALGLPTLASHATIKELQRDDVLRAVVAVRLRDVAGAVVDLPTTLLLGRPGHDVDLTPELLTPNSRALASESGEISADQRAVFTRLGLDQTDYASRLNPPADPASRPPMRLPSSRPSNG